MTPLDAMLELLSRLGSSQDAAALVDEEELSRWPAVAVKALKSCKLLVRASPATTVVCPGCEHECTMPLHTVSDGTAKMTAFVVCDKRDDTNRVPIAAERIRQWCCGMEAVGAFVAHSLKLRPGGQRKTRDGLWELGPARGNKRSQMLCLRAGSELELVAGNRTISLPELVNFTADGYSVDSDAVRQLVDSVTTADSRYTPSNARREARKLNTKALHEQWRKAYRALKQRHPGMSDKWYSQQIARSEAAKGRSAETIRKHMTR